MYLKANLHPWYNYVIISVVMHHLFCYQLLHQAVTTAVRGKTQELSPFSLECTLHCQVQVEGYKGAIMLFTELLKTALIDGRAQLCFGAVQGYTVTLMKHTGKVTSTINLRAFKTVV